MRVFLLKCVQISQLAILYIKKGGKNKTRIIVRGELCSVNDSRFYRFLLINPLYLSPPIWGARLVSCLAVVWRRALCMEHESAAKISGRVTRICHLTFKLISSPVNFPCLSLQPPPLSFQ